MKTFQLSAEVREDKGKKLAKQLRKQGLVPAVIYGDGKEATMLTVKSSALRNLLFTPDIYVVELTVNDAIRYCIVQDVQFHPVTDNILHIDFLEVRRDKPIIIDVPVKLVGHSVGVRAGGNLHLDMRKIRVKALYEYIPEHLEIDITKLELGKAIQVGDLSFDNLELLNPNNAVVCAVRVTRLSLPEDELDEEGEGEEGEEATEGAEGAEAGEGAEAAK